MNLVFDQSLGTLFSGQTIYVAVGPNGSSGNDNFAFDFSITHAVPDAYESWMETWYPGQTDPGIVGFDADPYLVGYSNGIAFLNAATPLSVDPLVSPANTENAGVVTYSFRRSDRAGGFSPTIECSTSLTPTSWIPTNSTLPGITVTVIDNGYDTDAEGFGVDRIDVEIDTATIPEIFLRQSVTRP